MKGMCAWDIYLERTYTCGLFRLKLETWGVVSRERMVSWDKKSSKPDDYMRLGEESSKDLGSGWRSSTSVGLLWRKINPSLKMARSRQGL